MARFTLLELHFEDAEFTANAPYSQGDDEDGAETERHDHEAAFEREDAETSGGSVIGLFVGLAAAVGVVYAARRLLSREDPTRGEEETEFPMAAD